MRMIIEVQEQDELLVTIAERVSGIPIGRHGTQVREWVTDNNEFYLDSNVRPIRPANDLDRIKNLPDMYPEYFL